MQSFSIPPRQSAIPASQPKVSAEFFAQILEPALILLPHSDDECAFGGLLQHLRDPTMVFLTDSAPADPLFWKHYGSRERYRQMRQAETAAALHAIGVRHTFSVVDLGITRVPRDQELYLHLRPVLESTRALSEKLKPRTILSPAYEGGHPDHDAASFLAAQLAREFQLQHWETPYYHRSRSGKFRAQSFLAHATAGVEIALDLCREELVCKRSMWLQYKTQAGVLAEFAPEREIYRCAPPYDFRRPPHRGTLNYEAWAWDATGAGLSRCFGDALRLESPRSPIHPEYATASEVL